MKWVGMRRGTWRTKERELQVPHDAAYATAQGHLTFPLTGIHHANPLAAELLVLLGLLLALLGGHDGLGIPLLGGFRLGRLVTSHD